MAKNFLGFRTKAGTHFSISGGYFSEARHEEDITHPLCITRQLCDLILKDSHGEGQKAS